MNPRPIPADPAYDTRGRLLDKTRQQERRIAWEQRVNAGEAYEAIAADAGVHPGTVRSEVRRLRDQRRIAAYRARIEAAALRPSDV